MCPDPVVLSEAAAESSRADSFASGGAKTSRRSAIISSNGCITKNINSGSAALDSSSSSHRATGGPTTTASRAVGGSGDGSDHLRCDAKEATPVEGVAPGKPANTQRDTRLNFLFNWIPGCANNPVGMIELPLCLFLCVAYRSQFRSGLILPLILLHGWKECVPMSVCLHRYFSHKGFKCSRFTQFGLYLIACLASQGPPLWWASKHRRHHTHCDTEGDPHSPVTRSKLYAWVGWVYLPGAEGAFGAGCDEDYVRDHLKFPELAYMENFCWLPVWAVHGALYAYGGFPYFAFVSLLSGVLCQLVTLFFNVAFHENEDAEGTCKAMDKPEDPLSNIYGEAYHAWHHEHPRAYRRPGLDLPYWIFIKPGLSLGFFSGGNLDFSINSKTAKSGKDM